MSMTGADSNRRGFLLGIAVAMFAMATIPFVATASNLAFPVIGKHFAHTSRATLSWVLTGTAIATAALTLLGGQLSDRLGGFRMFLTGLVLSVVSNIVAAFAPNPGILIAARAAYGVAAALVLPSSLGVALARCPTDRRMFVIGLWSASFPIASCVTPVASALTIDAFGWRGVFAATAVLSLIAVTLALLLGEDEHERPTGTFKAPDYLGILLGTASVGLLALAIVKGRAWGWTSPTIASVAGTSLALGVWFVRRSRRHLNPLFDVGLFRLRSYRMASIANLMVAMIGSSTWLLFPLVMAGLWKYAQFSVGLAMTPMPVIGATLTLLVTRRARTHGYGATMVVGTCFTVAGLVCFVLFPTVHPNYWTGMFPGLVLAGIGTGLTFAPLNAAALVDVSRERLGSANAAFATGRSLSGAIGIAGVVALLDGHAANPLTPFDRAFGFLAVIAIAACAVLVIAWRGGSSESLMRA